jgi:hypothetical protein
VRLIFSRYLDLGSLSALQRDLRERVIVTRRRTLSSGRAIGIQRKTALRTEHARVAIGFQFVFIETIHLHTSTVLASFLHRQAEERVAGC